MQEGQTVQFNVVRGSRGPQASDVKVLQQPASDVLPSI
ncbi:MAG TPA: cold shock domain-containing protein [Syntrophomonadaceae bacterium]|nr:cold shock domain-containing protein [Syntrophomonadaceae bacterium]